MAEENGSDIELSPLLESLSEAYAEDPTSKKFLPLAEEYRKSKMYDEAIYFCKEGLKQHPHYVPALLTIARCYMDIKEYGDAMASLSQIVDRQPENPSAHRMIGDLYKRRGDFDHAREHYEIVLRTRPGDLEAQQRMREMDGPEDVSPDAIDISSVSATSDTLVRERDSGGLREPGSTSLQSDPDKFLGEEETVFEPGSADEVPDLDLDEGIGGDEVELTLEEEDSGIPLSLEFQRPVEIVSQEPGGEVKPVEMVPGEPVVEREEDLQVHEVEALSVGTPQDEELPVSFEDASEVESLTVGPITEEGSDIGSEDLESGLEGLDTGDAGAEPVGGKVTSIGAVDAFDEEILESETGGDTGEEITVSEGDGRDVLAFGGDGESELAEPIGGLESEEEDLEDLGISADGIDTTGVEDTIEREGFDLEGRSFGDAGEHIVVDTDGDEAEKLDAGPEAALEQNVVRAEVVELDDLGLEELGAFPDEVLFLERGQVVAESVSMGHLKVGAIEEVGGEVVAEKPEPEGELEFELGENFVLEGVEEELEVSGIITDEPEDAAEEEPMEDTAEPPAAEEATAEASVPDVEEVVLQTKTTARIYEQQGHYEEALKVYRQLHAQNPDDAELEAKIKELERRTPEPAVIAGADGATVEVLSRWLQNIDAFRKKIGRG